jgi:hypothetical protein
MPNRRDCRRIDTGSVDGKRWAFDVLRAEQFFTLCERPLITADHRLCFLGFLYERAMSGH